MVYLEPLVSPIRETPDSATVATARRRRVARIGLVVALLGFGACLLWATEPRRRREILFESAVRLRTGEIVTGRFTPDHDGPFVLELRFRGASQPRPGLPSPGSETDPQALAEALGGKWRGSTDPVGLSASYALRRGPELVARGATGDRFTAGWWGAREAGVQLAWFDGTKPAPHDFELRIDRVVASLADRDARLVIAAAGDYIHYATMESDARLLLVFCATGVLMVLVIAITLYREVKRPRVRDSAREP